MSEQTVFLLKYLPIKVSLVSIGKAVLPTFLGATLRGVIGRCLGFNSNAYVYLYNQRALCDNRQDVVNPYVIVPPLTDITDYPPGEELNFEIYLVGDAVKYVQALVKALYRIEEFGLGASRYPFVLSRVLHSLDQRVIWRQNKFYKRAARSVILPCRSLADVKQLTLYMYTPLRIRRDGMLLEKVDFPTIIRNITRRVEALTERYGGWTDKREIEHVQELAADVVILQDHLKLKKTQRYSARLGRKIDWDGLEGSIQFKGNLTPFVPWLYAAQILHIGRNTTFGMGRIGVEFV